MNGTVWRYLRSSYRDDHDMMVIGVADGMAYLWCACEREAGPVPVSTLRRDFERLA